MQDNQNTTTEDAADGISAQPKRRCNCRECQRMDTLRRLSKTMTEEQKAFVMELYEDLVHASMDSAHYKAILNGTWPDAKNALERGLKLAEAQPKFH